MPANLENSAVATGLEKLCFIPVPKKGNAEEYSNYCIIALFSHASKVMVKILQARLQQYMNHELPDVQAGFRKSRDITLPAKFYIVKAMVFPVAMYGCKSWTIKKAERRRIDAFEL